MRNKNVVFLTQAAMIAAIYVVLTYMFAPFSFGEVQVRIAEALTILPVFTPAAVPLIPFHQIHQPKPGCEKFLCIETL